jgi:hypothetical protein
MCQAIKYIKTGSLENIFLKLCVELQNLLKSVCQWTLFCGQDLSESRRWQHEWGYELGPYLQLYFRNFWVVLSFLIGPSQWLCLGTREDLVHTFNLRLDFGRKILVFMRQVAVHTLIVCMAESYICKIDPLNVIPVRVVYVTLEQISRFFCLFSVRQPPVGQGLLIHEISRSHS